MRVSVTMKNDFFFFFLFYCFVFFKPLHTFLLINIYKLSERLFSEISEILHIVYHSMTLKLLSEGLEYFLVYLVQLLSQDHSIDWIGNRALCWPLYSINLFVLWILYSIVRCHYYYHHYYNHYHNNLFYIQIFMSG